MAYTFDQANANAPSKRDTQYFEMFANRGIYHDGWYACTTPPAAPWLMGTAKLPEVNEYKWELYNIAAITRSPMTSQPRILTSCESYSSCSCLRRQNTRSCRWTTRSCRV